MKIRSKIKWFALLLIFLPFTAGFDTISHREINAWLPYWDIKDSTQIFERYFSNTIAEINPFVYVFDKEANIINTCKNKEQYANAINKLKKLNTRIIPTITNDVVYSKTNTKLKDQKIIHKILNSDSLRQKHIQQIIDIADELNAPGIDIDYETIHIADKDLFSQFIKELSIKLHSQNKTLSVTVQQKTTDHSRSGAGAIDWKEISKYADKIIIMCYGYSTKMTKPGPTCPYYWLKQIIRFARRQIPHEKISIALPLYGYDWSRTKTTTVSFKTAKELIEKYKPRIQWDHKSYTPYFIYYKDGVRHTVWFENKKSLQGKMKLVKKSRIPYLALWHLGLLDPSLKDTLQQFIN